jgi:glyoxylase-like metal-dependent hydrolase (beta-lactamase superfamily II)
MNIGPYTLSAIETGNFRLDGGAMFGVVPWMFWSKTNPPDERQRITLAARCLLIRGNGRIILVDTGNGSKWNDKLRDIYALDNSRYDLLSSLRAQGVDREDVTDVILTHLHFDHAGGSTMRVDGKLQATFPRATHYVQRTHWELSQHPTEKDRASFIPEDFELLMEKQMLELVDGETQIFPGIDLIVTNGHTSAQQLPLISDGTTSLLYCCDLIPTSSHVPIPYVMGYDVRPLGTLEEKKRILPRAAEENWILFLEHDERTSAIRVVKTEKGFSAADPVSL